MNQDYNWEKYEEYEDLLIVISKKYCRIIGDFDLFEDLKNAGAIGLARASAKYDPENGASFETYASHWIKDAILKELNNNWSFIKIPKRQKLLMMKVKKLKNEYSQVENEERCLRLIADELGLSEDDVNDLLVLSYRVGGRISLDTPLSEDDETTIGDTIASENQMSVEEAVFRSIMEEEMEEYLHESLSERSIRILKMRYGDEKMTFDEIGKILDISAARVSQIEKTTMEILRRSGKFRKFLEYLAA
ncbi:MAG: sigma-70 family RNA polymerase sigma factor [Eubacterium sp.]|nr:sigma-70 family RNA polymerase sigma factor [Eubacterium sp.]